MHGRNMNTNTPTNMLTTNNMLSLQINMAKDIKLQIGFKKKLRMNSEEKLMAKKVEQANNAAKYAKTQGNKYVRLGSENERKSSAKGTLKKNTSQLLTSNGSGYSNHKVMEKSNEMYLQMFQKKKASIKSSKNRVGSPVTDIYEDEKQEKDEAYQGRKF